MKSDSCCCWNWHLFNSGQLRYSAWFLLLVNVDWQVQTLLEH